MSFASTGRHSLGVFGATSLVVGNIIGTGILMLPASLGAFGTLGLLGWAVTTVGSICLALLFSRLSRRFPKTGGPYVYCKEAFGELTGFLMAWCYWVGCWAGNAALAVAFVGYLTHFWPSLSENNVLQFIVAAGSVWFFTILNSLSLRASGFFQVVIAMVKIVPLIVVAVAGGFFIESANYFPLNPMQSSWFQITASTSALTLFAFMGFESATIPAEDVANPEKTVPFATIIGTLISAVIYMWVTFVLLGIMPSSQLAKSQAPFADASQIIFGSDLASIIAFCALLSAFGTLNGWILLQGQMPLAAARDNLFPAIFGRLSRFLTPVFGLIFSSVLLTFVLSLNFNATLVNQFTAIATLTTFALLLPYVCTALADLKFLLTDKKTPAKAILPVCVCVIALLYTLLATWGAGLESIELGIALVLLGLPVYAWMKRARRSTC